MPLVDTGLVVRYALDDAGSGTITTVSSIADIGPNAYDLDDLNAGSSALSWTEVSGNRGLVCSSTTGTQRARKAMGDSGDAVRTALAGGNAFTIELVLDSGSLGNSGNGRWIAVTDRAGGNGDLALRLAAASNTWSVSFNGTATSNFTNSTSGRHVLHVVIDTTQATQNDRVRYSINGGSLQQVSNTISQNATLSIGTSRDLILFNRESSGSFDRSIAGTLFYAAIYAQAFDSTEITNNYDILTTDDDPTGGAAPTHEQEGARFGYDDGSESAHTWRANQDANAFAPLSENVLLRCLINATGDTASTAYTLRYQKNGSGGYAAVPVGAGSSPTAASVRGSATSGGSTSASGGIAITLPTRVAGDLIVVVWGQDWNGNTPSFSHNGSGWSTLVDQDNGTVTGVRVVARIATNDANDNITITGIAQDYAYAAFAVQDHGVTTIATDVKVATPSTGSDAAPDPPSLDAGSSQAWLWLEGFAADDDDDTATYWSTDFTGVAQQQSASSTNSCLVAVAARANHTTQTYDPGVMALAATEEWVAFTIAVPPAPGVNNELYVATSANVTAGGEATTARLTAPSGKTTSDFVTGRRWDDENGTDSIDITTDDYTEVEWCLQAQSPAVNGDYFDFRVYAGASPLDTYSVTPRLTLGTPATPSAPLRRRRVRLTTLMHF